MSPRGADMPPDDVLAELRRVAAEAVAAQTRLRETVLAALEVGSVRTVAKAAGLSPTTVQKWRADSS